MKIKITYVVGRAVLSDRTFHAGVPLYLNLQREISQNQKPIQMADDTTESCFPFIRLRIALH